MRKFFEGVGKVVLVPILLIVCLGWGLIRGYALNWMSPIFGERGGLK